jgi:MFS family permease
LFAAAILSKIVADRLMTIGYIGKLIEGNEYSIVLLLAAFASLVSLILACIIRNVTNGMTKKNVKVGAVLKDGPLMKIIFINAAVYFSVDVVSSYLQEFGEKTLLLSAATATLVMSSVKLSAIFVRAFLGWLSRFFGSARLLKISLFVISLTIILMGSTKQISLLLSKIGLPFDATKVVVIMIIGLLYGLANGLVNPLALIELSNASTDANRGPALALRNMCNSGGQTLGDVAFGYLLGAFSSYSPVFWVSGTVLFGCFLASFDRKKKE